jgi:hypothetical protein
MPVLVPGIGSHVRTSTTVTGQLNGGGAVSVPCTENYAASPRMIGRRNLTNQNAYYFDGVISELIQFGRALTGDEVRLIQSYLAVKYGITLDQTTPSDYLDSTGAIVWDANANVAHRHNIAGIGRDDASGLIQRQSQSVNLANSGNLVTMGLSTIASDNASNPGAFGADRNFLIWGDDGGSTTFATTIMTPNVGSGLRMTRTWRVQETGTVGSAKVGVPSTIAPGALVYLVVSNDTAFDNTDQWQLMTPHTAGAASYLTADADFTRASTLRS